MNPHGTARTPVWPHGDRHLAHPIEVMLWQCTICDDGHCLKGSLRQHIARQGTRVLVSGTKAAQEFVHWHRRPQSCSGVQQPAELRLRLRTRDKVGDLRVEVAEEVGYVVNEENGVVVAKQHPLVAVMVQSGMSQEGGHGCSAITG